MFLYILQNSLTKKYYIGITSDLNRRLHEHNSKNGHYTGNMPSAWEILSIRWFDSKIEARREEIRLKKSKNKTYLEWYISAHSSGVEQSPLKRTVEGPNPSGRTHR